MAKAIVTGGSRGIGRAICVELAKAGYDVVVNYNGNEEKAKETAKMCENHGVKSTIFGANVANEAEVGDLFTTIETNETLDLLVNNAGITKDGLLVRMSTADFDEVIRTNLTGAFNCSKWAARLMMKQRFGKIVNISSVAGVAGNAGQANYSASKAGLIGLTKSLAKELAPRNICVNAVAPGFIETEMTAVLSESVKSEALAEIPLKRMGQPHDVAKAVLFLATADYITGQVLLVDGGMVI